MWRCTRTKTKKNPIGSLSVGEETAPHALYFVKKHKEKDPRKMICLIAKSERQLGKTHVVTSVIYENINL